MYIVHTLHITVCGAQQQHVTLYYNLRCSITIHICFFIQYMAKYFSTCMVLYYSIWRSIAARMAIYY